MKLALIVGIHAHPEGTMKKQFVAPRLVEEATLAKLTLFQCTSNCPAG